MSEANHLTPDQRCPHGIRWPHECRECADAPIPVLSTFRRIIQISTTRLENTSATQADLVVYALCDDGILWEKWNWNGEWVLVDTAAITTTRVQR